MTIDKALLRKQYEAKQQEREREANPLRQRQLFEDERELRIKLEQPHPDGGCYTCGKAFPIEGEHFPFCAKPCHERWASLNEYHERTVTGASDLDIRRRQKRALEIAGEIRAKRGARVT